MTQGVFEVAGIHHATIPEEKLLEYAAMAESFLPPFFLKFTKGVWEYNH